MDFKKFTAGAGTLFNRAKQVDLRRGCQVLMSLMRSVVKYLGYRLETVTSVVRYPRYLDTYRRYLRDDTSIAKVTIYRGIS